MEPQQSQVAIFGVFLHKPTQVRVLFVTTHLKAKPGFEERRAKQGAIILTRAEELSTSFNVESIIIAGDFNDTPDSPVATLFLSSGNRNPCGPFSSAYSSYPSATSYGSHLDAPYTTFKKRETEVCRTIDFIWFQGPLQVSALLEIPAIDNLPQRLPASYYPSDHLGIAATFQVNK